MPLFQYVLFIGEFRASHYPLRLDAGWFRLGAAQLSSDGLFYLSFSQLDYRPRYFNFTDLSVVITRYGLGLFFYRTEKELLSFNVYPVLKHFVFSFSVCVLLFRAWLHDTPLTVQCQSRNLHKITPLTVFLETCFFVQLVHLLTVQACDILS